jgi:plasmid stabilization system protein ParE
MRTSYSNEAIRDLNRIYQYGKQKFGLRVAREYSAKLKHSISIIEKYPMIARIHIELGQKLRVHQAHSHVVIYEFTDPDLRIVRVLRSEQNWVDHL